MLEQEPPPEWHLASQRIAKKSPVQEVLVDRDSDEAPRRKVTAEIFISRIG
jgi:hypothetical protein